MKQYDIYIDGSHLDKQNNGRLGAGGVLVNLSSGNSDYGELLNKFSMELSPEYMKFNFGSDHCSNPSAELTALLCALYQFKGSYGSDDKIVVHADYLGVKEWMTGAWKIKEPYIARIKSEIDKEINKQGLKGRIEYKWVKGHQKISNDPDTYWNNYVDSLAKGKNE